MVHDKYAELERVFGLKKTRTMTSEVKIVYSKSSRQYVIRLPRKFGDVLNIKSEDKFKFILKIPDELSNSKPKLTGELTYGEEQK